MLSPIKIAKEREIINKTIRLFFSERAYVEVETPLIVKSPGMEPNLIPFETTVIEPNHQSHTTALITSPEYAMKKLLGYGMEKIFTITKVFRNEESLGGNHNPEFTMLEWYKQGSDYQACMSETEAMIRRVANELCGNDWQYASQRAWKRVRVRDLFLEHVQLDLDLADVDSLKSACRSREIHFTDDDSESDLFYRLFLSCIEPNLGTEPVFIYDYPIHQAALSKLRSDGMYGERFELYINGLELCNGFSELTNATEQRKRFEQEAEERKILQKTVYPIDEELLRLLPSLKDPTFGNALGIDRLHMVLTDRTRIQDVVLFPADQLFI